MLFFIIIFKFFKCLDFLLFLQKKYAHVFVSVYGYVHKRGLQRGQKRALGPLGQEVQFPGVDTRN